jgi:CBS domain containing-hemolysin-like protein
MTSRPRMQVLDVTATPDEVAARIAESPRSRYPIVDGDLDHVVGVLHIKDFIRASQRGRSLELARWHAHCRPSWPARLPINCWRA